GQKRDRWILFFEGQAQGLVLNRSNAELLVALFGRDTEGWIGHWVTLGVQQVRMGKDMVPGIRVVGSPELKAPKTVTVKLPRKKPQDVVLRQTGKKTSAPEPAQN